MSLYNGFSPLLVLLRRMSESFSRELIAEHRARAHDPQLLEESQKTVNLQVLSHGSEIAEVWKIEPLFWVFAWALNG